MKDREKARLLVLDRNTGAITHAVFAELGCFFERGDLIVLNDTKVIPARFVGRRVKTGGRVEVLLIEPAEQALGAEWAAKGITVADENEPLLWLAYTHSGGRLRPGERIAIEEAGGLTFTLLERLDEAGDLVAAESPADESVFSLMERFGHTPLPPYIDRGRTATDTPEDREFYQTVYARRPGAVAAPTAGLHFTDRMLDDLSRHGIEIAVLTLHVGPGTFRPVKTERPEDHVMHSERYEVPAATLRSLAAARKSGAGITAVGTTVVRTLETLAHRGFPDPPLRGRTDIFIRPPYEFQLADRLVTNFHLPKSTLLMLVAAFAGLEPILAAYEEAKREGYRFFSYGDAMLIM